MYKQIIPATGWLYVEHHKEQDAIRTSSGSLRGSQAIWEKLKFLGL